MTEYQSKTLALLGEFVRQRPGLEAGNYFSGGNWQENARNYRREARGITRDLHDARALLDACLSREFSQEQINAAFRAFSGRLQLVLDAQGTPERLEYCTGQYWPTEYRKAVCAVLASLLWDYTRDHAMPKGVLHHNSETGETLNRYNGLRAGDWLRKHFRHEFGARIGRTWFD